MKSGYLYDGSVVNHTYINIKKIETPKDKEDSRELFITLVSNEVVSVPVRNGEGKFRESLEFLRFLDRVISDLID